MRQAQTRGDGDFGAPGRLELKSHPRSTTYEQVTLDQSQNLVHRPPRAVGRSQCKSVCKAFSTEQGIWLELKRSSVSPHFSVSKHSLFSPGILRI